MIHFGTVNVAPTYLKVIKDKKPVLNILDYEDKPLKKISLEEGFGWSLLNLPLWRPQWQGFMDSFFEGCVNSVLSNMVLPDLEKIQEKGECEKAAIKVINGFIKQLDDWNYDTMFEKKQLKITVKNKSKVEKITIDENSNFL